MPPARMRTRSMRKPCRTSTSRKPRSATAPCSGIKILFDKSKLLQGFSRFWFIAYLLSPIIFARRAGGEDADGFIRGAWKLTAGAGTAFLTGVAGVLLLAPALAQRFIGLATPAPIMAFAAAVVIASFTQLRLAQLQGSGAARRVMLVMGASALISAVLFFVFARQFGVAGLLFAWLIKSVIDLGATMVGGRRGLARQPL